LACKVEETPKKLKDIILTSYYIRNKKSKILDVESKEYVQTKEKLLQTERVLLSTLSFDLKLVHPYKFLLQYVKKYDSENQTGLAQTGWNFINDSLRTKVCLMYPPDNVASAAFLLASKYIKFKIPEDDEWLEYFKIEKSKSEGNCFF
jgi:cyclin T